MKQKQVLEELLQNRVFKYFYEISQIPRGSYHEEAISRYLTDWAKERNFFVFQDHLKNVLIRKPASKGYEKFPGILLQAHMDMVCEKTPESTHDFSKDPIPWVINGDILSTGGETTLGADDGIGVALAMAVLEEDSWKHPELEVLFTTAEEEDLSGASGFDASLLHSSYLINLDNSNDNEILCGSCGGEAVEVTLPVQWEPLPENYTVCNLEISGLKGGHSGEDIHRGHGNANKMLIRILMELEKHMDIKMSELKGGSFRLAIPREAETVIALPGDKLQKAENIIQEMETTLKQEYQTAGTELRIRFQTDEQIPQQVCSVTSLISLILLSPDGIFEMNSDIEHVVNSSDNLGEVYLQKQGYLIIYEIRSAYNSARDYIAEIIGRLTHLLGGSFSIHSAYPGWTYQPDSSLRTTAAEVMKKMNGCSPKIYSVHAGLECGCFFSGKPDLDAISIGPNCWGLHSPQEKLSISSTKKIYAILKVILEELHKNQS